MHPKYQHSNTKLNPTVVPEHMPLNEHTDVLHSIQLSLLHVALQDTQEMC